MSDAETLDWGIMCGYYHVKRALEIAASGNHSILLVGPSHADKTRMARSLMTILPPATPFLESIDGRFDSVERARGGVLLLEQLERGDESSLALLRESVSRHPGQILLIATTGYCPCGEYGGIGADCRCSQQTREEYQRRLSTTVYACFALEVSVPGVNAFASVRPEESSRVVRRRVEVARHIQHQRHGKLNSALSFAEIESDGSWDAVCRDLLASAQRQLALSAEQERYLRQVARTCADLEERAFVPWVGARFLAEAISARPRWGKPMADYMEKEVEQ